MNGKSLFIGSSKEAKRLAKAICKALSSKRIQTDPWWNAFPPGAITLPRLLKLSKIVDGAIFIFRADDKQWYRKKKVSAVRDNVIFEFGIFVSQLGVDKCIIVCDNKAKIPSDLSGLTFLCCERTHELTATKVSNHFANIDPNDDKSTGPRRHRIQADPRLALLQVEHELPNEWLLRSFYLGLDGAKAWLSVSTDPTYRINSGIQELRKCLLKHLSAMKTRHGTFVSLGPGDGILDEDIVLSLKSKEPSLKYIPVDLSDGLLIRVLVALDSKVAIPFGLLADFEGQLDFVIHNVNEYGRSPVLYGLLGGTFGNLDTTEHSFIRGLTSSFSHDDALIMDVGLNKPGSMTHDTAPSIDKMSPGRKLFYSHGAARALGIKTNEVFEHFSDYVCAEVHDGPSDIPETRVVVFFVKSKDSKRPFAYMRRYNPDRLVTWLKNDMNCKVIFERFASPGLFDRGLLIIKRNIT